MKAPIAIVGRGCVLPGALDPASLWQLVIEGRDAITSAPEERWRLARARAMSADPAADRAYSDRGGYVRGFDARFDPSGFAIDAGSIAALDPIFRWTLHASREALREAGVDPRSSRAGIVLGNLSFPTASHAALVEHHWLREALGEAVPAIDPRERFHSSLVASLTARALSLRGAPSFCLDAACASSLYAIAIACDALRDRRADVMLAGAVNCTDDLFIHVGFSALEAMSKTGRSRPFHPDADGLVPAEGAAVVALMRLDDALRGGTRVLGVIRGVGLANDGRARSFLAPSEEGQVRAMRAAYREAGLAPSDISWVECHATGTRVGDATEARSTARVFEGCRDVPIGSLKANLGHSITAAGAAGLLKVLGALEAGVRPPTPHLDRVSDALDRTPLRVVTQAEPWDAPIRRAAVSAFGFGGNDAHLIVEAPDAALTLAQPALPPGQTLSPDVRAESSPSRSREGAGGRVARESGDSIALPARDPHPSPSPRAGEGAPSSADTTVGQPPTGEESPSPRQRERLGAREPIAVVGIGMRVGPFASAEAFADALASNRGGRRTEQIELPLSELRTPPADLARALGQQTSILAAALDARVDDLDPDRTAVLIGMQCDAEIARYGARWRLPELFERAGLDPRDAQGTFAPPLTAAGVLGTMPNIPANRINRELDLRGPSCTISADELSGIRALEIAIRALHERELDHALVGAVDLACEPVHERAAKALLPAELHRGGDAAIVLVLERLEDARTRGRPVLAIITPEASEGDSLRVDVRTLAPRFGHALAASGLLHVAAAALCLHRRARIGEPANAWASDGPRRAIVEVDAWSGERSVVHLEEDEATPIGAVPLAKPAPPRALVLPAHPPTPRISMDDALAPAPHLPVPRWELARAPVSSEQETLLAPPTLTPVLALDEPLTGAPTTTSRPSLDEARLDPQPLAHGERAALLDAIAANQRQLAAIHADFVRTQTEQHMRFLATSESVLAALAPGRSDGAQTFEPHAPASDKGTLPREEAVVLTAQGAPSPARGEGLGWGSRKELRSSRHFSSLPSALPPPASGRGSSLRERSTTASEREGKLPAQKPWNSLQAREGTPPSAGRIPRGLAPNTPPPAPRGRTFDRAALEVHASGTISSIFGPEFAPQNVHAIQVRMPEPPLLLADRVTGLIGEPASMGKGTVWTETDVRNDSWYLANGRMPAGLMIESGQADLFLISWLGADLLNRGERAYRLLGCTLTWHRSPPRAGETLAYDIHVDGHAKQGDVRLFFFHYDCHIDGEPALTVRSGQAGFFTADELAASAGVLFSPEDHEVTPDGRVDPPLVSCPRSSFDDPALEALSRGDVSACFGEGYEATKSHVRTPTIAGGRMRFLERVTDFDPRGGPHGRGYLRAVTRISPDDWYFSGHFKNDPCMPGTLMLEGCLSAMSFYLIGLGTTLDRDGWRFEPIPHETYSMICRGQVIPCSKELTYEVFVDEVHDGPIPKLYADLLCTVDGRKAFHAKRMGLQLVPDWPITSHPELPNEHREVAELDGVKLGSRALLASAWGRPSDAFGPRYREYDGLRRAPRLPGPPYHMVSRVARVDGEPWTKKSGASVEMHYDVPRDAWYFDDGASGAMPFALLLEAALQPCGWLASYTGCVLGREEDLRFRNLDGEGEVLAEVPRDAGTLTTRATLTSLSDTASMVIVGFDVTCALGEVDVYRLKTTFGFFPDAAFRDRVGLPIDDAQRTLLERTGARTDLRAHPLMQRDRLALLDEIAFFDPRGGRAGLGAARAETRVDPGAWFFRAHFFQDPVQPGSLGMEAMLALLRYCMVESGCSERMSAPRFAPIARTRHRWKYRGQVLPSDRRIAVTLEVTTLEREEERVFAEAEASFWIDGKRIYEATIATELVDDGAKSAAPIVRTDWPRDGHADADAIGRFWRGFLGTPRSPADDLYLALLRRFVRRVHVADPAALDAIARPVVYLANHQTAIETLMLSMIAGAASGIPPVTLAKIEHRESWLGRLLAWIFAHPSVREPELTAYFDRSDPASLPAILHALPRGRSLLVHVEGTRARSARHRIERISGVPIEHAIERELSIVPVRFTGGLPVDPVDRKLDFPLAMGAQDVWIGAPIESLAALGYRERIDVVRDAIEALGPRADEPAPGDLAFASEVSRHAEETGIDLADSVLACALREARDPSELTKRIVAGDTLDRDDPVERWAGELSARCFTHRRS